MLTNIQNKALLAPQATKDAFLVIEPEKAKPLIEPIIFDSTAKISEEAYDKIRVVSRAGEYTNEKKEAAEIQRILKGAIE
jgi:hypothetical protein